MFHDRRLFALAAVLCLAVPAGCTRPWPEAPATRVAPVHDVIHGVEFVDDYRWLEEQDTSETREWIAAQNEYAERVIGESPERARIRARLRELIDRADVGTVRRAGDFEYFSMRRVGEEAAVIYRRPFVEAEGGAAPPSVDDEYEVVLDPSAFDPELRTLVALMGFSPDGRVLMYSVREGGADEIEVRFRDMSTGLDLPDRLPRALYGAADFDDSGAGFFYTYRSRQTGPRIRYHRFGDPTGDAEIFGAGYGPTTYLNMNTVGDGRYRLFNAQHGWARNDLFLQDLSGEGAIEPMVRDVPAHFDARFHDGRIVIRTDYQAPMYRLMVADPARPQLESWVELIAEGDQLLQSYTIVNGRIFVTYLDDVSDRIAVYDTSGAPLPITVAVPEHASASITGGAADNEVELTVRSHRQPAVTFVGELDDAEAGLSLKEPADVPFDPASMEVRQVWFTSADGTRAPMYVLHRPGIELDGSHPTLLNGYGGFNVAIKPGFSNTAATWVEMGGVYAIATLRGGNEFGEDWHRDGMLENKQNVFDDFIAAAEWLIANRYTSSERLGITGGSNGGLLVAAAMTQRPELFRAVLCTYPDLDMIRFNTFTANNNMPALLEYGDAAIPEQFEAIRKYSPYQAVRDGVAYPAVMLTTGDLDTRVPPHQARKMTARLQAATSSGLPVILYYDPKGGHAAGRGRPLSMRIEDGARELAFMAQQLGLRVAETPAVAPTADPFARGLTPADFPRVQRLAADVYSYEQLRSAGDEMFTTVSLFVVSPEGVLVADGQGSVEETRRLLATIAKFTDVPVTHVVIGSDHGDHTAGNSAFPSEARFFAHPTSAANLRRAAAAADRPSGAPAVRLPTDEVDERTIIELGDKTIHVLFLGRAHTGGDLHVYLPRERILFLSETFLHRVFPAMRTAYPSEWVAMIERAQTLDVDVFVPGHGFVDPPPTLRAELEVSRLALLAVIAEGRRLFNLGLSLEEAAAQADFGEFESWSLRASQGPVAIRQVYRELEGELAAQ